MKLSPSRIIVAWALLLSFSVSEQLSSVASPSAAPVQKMQACASTGVTNTHVVQYVQYGHRSRVRYVYVCMLVSRGWVFTGPAQIATAPVRVIILTLAGAVLKRYKSNFNIKSHVYITDLLGLSIT